LDGFASLRNSQFWLEGPGDKSDGQTDLIGAAERKRIVQNFATGHFTFESNKLARFILKKSL
jgi:hypothetical protein